jgi:hypothetical protein
MSYWWRSSVQLHLLGLALYNCQTSSLSPALPHAQKYDRSHHRKYNNGCDGGRSVHASTSHPFSSVPTRTFISVIGRGWR